MTSLDEVILREFNPFDAVTFKTGNFWGKGADSGVTTVESIHAEVFEQVSQTLSLVTKTKDTRTILMTGDSGCGKSYLLKRLKNQLNSKAFFVYVDPGPGVDYVWRHTLRYTVNSLLHTPEGEKESQLLLWLKSFSVFQDKSLIKKILGQKTLFINHLKKTNPTGIYQGKDFFTALYELTQPEKYSIACDWLRGENLDDEDLRALGVSAPINTEDVAQGILSNFGKIAEVTKPIVLCFDQMELLPKRADGSVSLNLIFELNTSFHNSELKNFLIIISMTADIWRQNKKNISQSDQARIQKVIDFDPINLEQAKAMWATRLYPIHAQTNSKPASLIAPLDSDKLEKKYPGDQVILREALTFGGQLYQEYKLKLIDKPEVKPEVYVPDTAKTDLLAEFKVLWQEEFQKVQQSVTRLRQFSSPELAKMLLEAMRVFGVKILKSQLLPGDTYKDFSFSYKLPNQGQICGIFWNEEPSSRSFPYGMLAAQKALQLKLCNSLILLRNEPCGNPGTKGNQIYKQIFARSHINVSVKSLHYLRTYQKLAAEAQANDLIIGFKNTSLAELQKLALEAKVLEDCVLFRDLKIITVPDKRNNSDDSIAPPPPPPASDITKCKDYIFNLMKINKMLAKSAVIAKTQQHFGELSLVLLNRAIEELCQENLISLLDSQGNLGGEVICLRC